jgi:hypothetical protein
MISNDFTSCSNGWKSERAGDDGCATLSFANCPARGVYFFFEDGEARTQSGSDSRVVRVGTHALVAGSKSTLRQRLSQHRGTKSGSGNHRGSIFRLLVGQALMEEARRQDCPSWGIKGAAKQAALAMNVDPHQMASAEEPIEQMVSARIGAMEVITLSIPDEPGPGSLRGFVERNAIAMLSNFNKPAIDTPSSQWLGHRSNRPMVRASGLWNQNHVDETYSPDFLEILARLIEAKAG